MTTAEFLGFASGLHGQRLTTQSRGAAFEVRVVAGALEITPESSGTPRTVLAPQLEAVLAEYRRSGSTKPSDYHDITHDSSYLTTLITLWISKQNGEGTVTIAERARPILEAAARWKDRCLLDGGSVFSDERLWAGPNFAALEEHFVRNLKVGGDDFMEKFESQLGPAPAAAQKLAAELLWVMYLILHKSAMGGEKKRHQIKR